MKISTIKRQISKIIFYSFFYPYFITILFIIFILLFYFNYHDIYNHKKILDGFIYKFYEDINNFSKYQKDFVNYPGPVLYLNNKYDDYVKKEILNTVKDLNLQLFVSINKDSSLRDIYFFDKKGNIISTPLEIYQFFYEKKIQNITNRDTTITGIIPYNNHSQYLLFIANGVFCDGDNFTNSY